MMHAIKNRFLDRTRSLALVFLLLSVIVSPFLINGGSVYACHDDGGGPPDDVIGCEVEVNPPEEVFEASEICGELDSGQTSCDCENSLDPDDCSIVRYIRIGINILSGLAGMAIVGGLMASGYMYMTARDNPGQVQAAKARAA